MSHRPIFRPSRSAFAGYTPQQICTVRGWNGQPIIATAPIKLGYLSLGGTTPDSDIAAMTRMFGLPMPKVTRIGTPQQADPQGANVENVLDMWSAWIYSALTGQPADITICFQPNDANGMPDAVRMLADAGVQVASCSWGSPESGWGQVGCLQMRQAVQYAQSKGMWLTAASGDSSANDGTRGLAVDCPSSIPEVIAVGGTNLIQRGGQWIESAWGDGRADDGGGGGGYSAVFSLPTYQQGVVGNSRRGAPDCSDVADPATGLAIVASGMPMPIGGTSGAAPVVAGLLAVARGAAMLAGKTVPVDPHAMLYASRSTIFADITTGSDGWPAAAGWDPATGNGTIILPALIDAMVGTGASPPVQPPVLPPVLPPIEPPVVTMPTFDEVMIYLEQAFARYPSIERELAAIKRLGDQAIASGLLPHADPHWPWPVVGGILDGLGGAMGGGGYYPPGYPGTYPPVAGYPMPGYPGYPAPYPVMPPWGGRPRPHPPGR